MGTDDGIPRFDDWEEREGPPRENHWLRRARQLGLRPDREAQTLILRGSIGGIATVVQRRPWRSELRRPPGLEKLDWLWSITATDLPLAGRLTLRPETAVTGLSKLVTGQDLRTGDADFDALALVRGEPAYALAVLSDPIRRALTVALSRGIRFEADRFSWSFWDRAMPRRVLSRARQLAVLAERMVLDDERVWQGLLRNAVRDPLRPVRRHNLEALAGLGRPPDEATLQAARAAASSDDPGMVAAAAPLWTAALHHSVVRLDALGEPALVCLLRFGLSEHRLSVIERLSVIGTPWCLGALGEASSGVLRSRRTRVAAREASQRVIAREGLEQGGLSLVEAPEGDLSLIPEADAGLEFAD